METFNRSLQRFLYFVTALLVIASLHFGREVLIPLALASLFTFLLNPLVKRFCRWGMPRSVSVGIVTVVSFCTFALLAWLLGGEMARLANDLPNHRQNIQKRIEAVHRIGESRIIQKLRSLVGDVNQPTSATPESADVVAVPKPLATGPAPAPQPQAVIRGEDTLMKALNMVVPTLAEAFGTAAVVILFVIFMLLRLDDIIQRVVRLVGYSRLTVTTKAIDESGDRIGRYLITQGSVNTIYGLVLAIGLAVIGLPYVVLWGVMAAILRFIPYIGSWLVAALVVGLSLAVFEGWTQPLFIIGFIVTLELLTNMILEPLLYGHSVGISDFALLLSIAFWTWLWDGVGLVLATPLTVCIVVFCKHLQSLEWVEVLMGVNPLPQPHLGYYQQHLANHEDVAQAMLEEAAQKDGVEAAVDGIVLPALVLTRREEVLGRLDRDETSQIYQSMRSSFMQLEENTGALAADQAVQAALPEAVPSQLVYGRALHGEADAQALQMLAALLPPTIPLEISSEPRMIGELVNEIELKKPAILCISVMPLRVHLAANTLCRRLRSKLPDLKILVCCWQLPEQELDTKSLREAGATWVVSSIKAARETIERQLL